MGLSVTKGGQINVNAWNVSGESTYLTQSTVLVTVIGTVIEVRRLGYSANQVGIELEKMGEKWKKILGKNTPRWET